jgi:hypothetical protein
VICTSTAWQSAAAAITYETAAAPMSAGRPARFTG